jgi:gluconate 5-dehydrogenase
MGDIDILVNHAEVVRAISLQEPVIEAWDQVINQHLRTSAVLSQITIQKSMMARRSGRIINVSPFSGLDAQTQAVMQLTRALATEWGPYNITVNAIGAGVFPTNLPNALLAAQSPWPGPGHDEDLKGVCVLLASDAGQHITGQWLAVDGGMSLMAGA